MTKRRKLPPGTVFAPFEDEAPAIGYGWRLVVPGTVRGKGKRATISVRAVHGGATRRIKLAEWEAIAAKAATRDKKGKWVWPGS